MMWLLVGVAVFLVLSILKESGRVDTPLIVLVILGGVVIVGLVVAGFVMCL